MMASQRNGKFCMFYVGLEFSIADIMGKSALVTNALADTMVSQHW
jgi:hypothetical protein